MKSQSLPNSLYLNLNILKHLFFYDIASCQLPAPKEDPKNKGEPGNDKPAKPKKVILNSGENLYAEIRDMNFSAVGPVLSREAKRITAEYEVCLLFCLLFCYFVLSIIVKKNFWYI